MPPAFRFKDTDLGYKRLLRKARDKGFQKTRIEVGILAEDGAKQYPAKAPSEGKTPPQPLRVIDVANINEYGGGHVPERSFIRGWADEYRKDALEDIKGALSAYLLADDDADPSSYLEVIAQRWVALIQERIANGIPPENAQSTIDRKGSSTPLIDTGLLRSSISYAIKDISKKARAEAKAARSNAKVAKARAKKIAKFKKGVVRVTKSVIKDVQKFSNSVSRAVTGRARPRR